MEVSELDKAVAYTKQFIDAVTPVAKQAYEIGLMTIRIDAVGDIVTSSVILAGSAFAIRWIRAAYKAGKAQAALPENARSIMTRDPSDHMFGDGIPHALLGFVCLLFSAVSAICLANVWLWVKLFAPQLWLAHRAVEAVLK